MNLEGRRAPLLLVASAMLCLVLTVGPVVARASPTGSQSPGIVPTRTCSCAVANPDDGGESHFQGHGPPMLSNYDEQIGMTFTQSFTSIEFNVTAIEQTDPLLGTGPAYLVNGLSSSGYWYQVGVSWDWAPGENPGTGFDMNYEVFDTSGSSIFPTDGQGGVAAFSGPVNPGDIVLLDLYFSNTTKNVVMLAEDTDTKATASVTYSNEGASFFVGLPDEVANSNGYFTGLMTEWYHGAPYYENEAPVVYTNHNFELTSGWMWMDEFDASTFQEVFASNTSAPVSFADPTSLQEFSYNDTTEYADAFELITGALTNITQSSGVPLVLSYLVKGGGTGYSAPTLIYETGGKRTSVPLSASPSLYFADPGSSWNVTSTLGGSTSVLRWETGQTTSEIANSSIGVVFVYYYQSYVTFGFSVVGGGTGYSPPTVSYTSLGTSEVTPVGLGVWADAGTKYQYSSPLVGSNGTVRWYARMPGTIGSSHEIAAIFYPQYLIAFEVSFKNTEVFPGVPLTATSGGQPYSTTLIEGVSKVWLDAGSTYVVPQTFSLEAGQRLLTNGSYTGSVTESGTIDLVYDRQFFVDVSQNFAAGGTVSPPSGWYDSGSTLDLNAVASSGWKFEGWQGVGSDSVSASQADFPLTVGPGASANETAVFYPGVAVDAAGPSSVSYSDGSVSGTVSGGTTDEIYVPPSSELKLMGSNVPFLTEFSGWSGVSNSSSSSVSLVVANPVSVEAHSAYNIIGIGISLLVVVFIIVAAVAMIRHRRKDTDPALQPEAAGPYDSALNKTGSSFLAFCLPASRARVLGLDVSSSR